LASRIKWSIHRTSNLPTQDGIESAARVATAMSKGPAAMV
jgi:hypothetical protein